MLQLCRAPVSHDFNSDSRIGIAEVLYQHPNRP